MINVSVRTCDECAHYSVCCYKNDFTNICEAVDNASVHDILNPVVINCRYFREAATTPYCLTSTTTY